MVDIHDFIQGRRSYTFEQLIQAHFTPEEELSQQNDETLTSITVEANNVSGALNRLLDQMEQNNVAPQYAAVLNLVWCWLLDLERDCRHIQNDRYAQFQTELIARLSEA